MRRTDWLARLVAEIEAARDKQGQFGSFDCALFAARCVDAISTDSAWEAELLAAYSDTASAARYLAAEGGLDAAVTKRLGESVPWWHAMRGDVCLVDSGDGPALAICYGELALGATTRGLASVPIASVIKAWRVT